jgi:hypothetical protein
VSTRTIIEINHDYLHTLRDRPDLLETLLRELSGSSIPAALNKHGRRYEYAPGIQILGQRHHSEPEWKQERRK